jgi:nucleoid-associated protein YgaU
VASADAHPASPPLPQQRSVVVQPGDSVWAIARRVQPVGDVRPLVDELVARHGSAAIVPGDVLTVVLRP